MPTIHVYSSNFKHGLAGRIATLALAFTTLIATASAAHASEPRELDYSKTSVAVGTRPLRILVMPNACAANAEVDTALHEILGPGNENGSVSQVIGSGAMTTYVIDLNPAHAEEVKSKLQKDSKHFGTMQQSRSYRPQVTGSQPAAFNDPLLPYQKHLQVTQVTQAWKNFGVSSAHGIRLGITDTGIDSRNADLPASKVIKRVDCTVAGGLETSRDADVQGHGTAMASTAAAVSNNGTLGASPGFDISIYSLRVANTNGEMLDEYLINSLQYAGTHNIKVLNWSLNAPPPYTVSNSHIYSPVLYKWMNWYANAQESCRGLIINSAGNESLKDDADRRYTPYLVVIAATDYDDSRCSFSNYGKRVDLSSPGKDILASLIGGDYRLVSGTSPAAAIVSGIVAKVWSQAPSLTNMQMKDLLIKKARRPARLQGGMGSGIVAMNSLLEALANNGGNGR